MSLWDHLLQLSAAGPFTGTWMSLGTAAVALAAVTLLRRLLPAEDRHHGRFLTAFLLIALLLGVLRLGVVALGAGQSTTGEALSTLITFLVALGTVDTAIMLFFEVIPLRARIRFPSILRDIIQLLALVVVTLGVVSQLRLATGHIVTSFSVLTAVVGLAMQNTISNLFAGLLLQLDRSLDAGDWVQVGQRTGRITQVLWRSTLLQTTDGDTVILPNSQMLTQEVYNFSRPSTRHRTTVRFTFHYRHPPNDVRRILVEAAQSSPGVLATPTPDCFPVEFGDSGIIYVLRFWLDQMPRRSEIEGHVRSRVWYAARRSGLEIPYPTRTVLSPSAVASPPEIDVELHERVGALERLDLLAPLEPEERTRLARAMRRLDYAQGEVLIRQGDSGDSLFLIQKGNVGVSLLQGDIEQEVATLGPGDFVGEMSLMTGAPRAATCVAVTDVVCYLIDRAAFQGILTTRPHMADELSALLAGRQADLEKKGDEMSARAAPAGERRKRLLTLIRELFDLKN